MLLKIFLVFLEIGAVSFGGGYGMISLIHEKVIENGWLTEDEFLNMIAVSESTPGPIAINMATFIGSSQAGILGSLVATLGVILPAFLIILTIVAILKNLLKYKPVDAILKGFRPAVVALILAVGTSFVLEKVVGITTINNEITFDYKALIIFVIIALTYLIGSKLRKKSLSPIILIIMSAILGILFYALK